MKKYILYFLCLCGCLTACHDEEAVTYTPDKVAYSTDEIDTYFQENFQEKYGCAVRWKWVDNYVETSYVVAPTMRQFLIPTGEMIRRFWIEPFLLESKESGDFIRKHFPPEIVCVGSELRNPDGTRTLGYADAGVRITLTELNFFDLSNKAWITQQLHTIHHEFSHIIHQTYNLPNGFNKISELNYTGQAWDDIYSKASIELTGKGIKDPTQQQTDSVAQNMAIMRGMLTPYGTSSEFEDFAEIVSIFLLTDPVEFEKTYLYSDPKRPFLDNGKAMIQEKLTLVKEYYKSNFAITLPHLRDIILQRLNDITKK